MPRDDVRRRRLLVALGLLAVGVLVVDQATKALAIARLTPGEYVPLIGDLFGLMLVFNPYAAFSLDILGTWFFTLIAVVVTVVIIRISRRLNSRGWALALGALLGGNLGNLADRLFREPGFARGHVVDFLDYGGLFVGNVADIAIVLAAAGMAVLAFLGLGIDGTRHAAKPDDTDAVESDDPDAVESDDTGAAAPDRADAVEPADTHATKPDGGNAVEHDDADRVEAGGEPERAS